MNVKSTYQISVLGNPEISAGQVRREILDTCSFGEEYELHQFLKTRGIVLTTTRPDSSLPTLLSIVPQLLVIIYQSGEDDFVGKPIIKWARWKIDSMDN